MREPFSFGMVKRRNNAIAQHIYMMRLRPRSPAASPWIRCRLMTAAAPQPRKRARTAAALARPPRSPSRTDGKVGVTIRLDPGVHAAIKRLAIDIEEAERREVTLAELFLSGVGLLFEKHGRPAPELDL